MEPVKDESSSSTSATTARQRGNAQSGNDRRVKAGYGPRVSEQHELRRGFHQQLEDINARVIRLFALVTEAIATATEVILASDTESARKLAAHDSVLDQLETDIEHIAEHELLTQQPMAGDMRYLVSVVRVVPELERSGDLAEHIASRTVTSATATLTPVCARYWRRWGRPASRCGGQPLAPGPPDVAGPGGGGRSRPVRCRARLQYRMGIPWISRATKDR